MGKHIVSFLRSFKFKTTYWFQLLHDAAFLGIILGFFTWFGRALENRSINLFQGNTPEQIQQLLLTAPEQVAPLVGNLRIFLVILVVGVIGLLLMTYLLYVLSRLGIWNKLVHNKWSYKPFGKWLVLHLALIFPLLGIGLIYLIFKILLGLIIQALFTANSLWYFSHQDGITIALTSINGMISLFLSLFVLAYLFHVYRDFVQRKKVWESIGKGFSVFRNVKVLFSTVGFATLIAIVITLIFFPIQKVLFTSPGLLSFLQIVVVLLYISWVRQYFFITHGHN
ncbi:hypothetical protein HOC32_01645 [Candidatus Woesearchaeota archaeon]|nr:hypothetical protein [Candidatus Woesearchaeota archaeon]